MARFINQNSLGAGWQFDFLDNEGVNTNPGFLGVLYHANTAKRTYTFPDKDGTLATTADALVNPMTTLGDIIIGGAAGAPARLAKGTDGQILKMVSGNIAWQDNTAGQAQEDVLGVVVDGGGVAITTGSKGYREVPYNCTITGWTILGKESGSCVVDVRRATYANFPTTSSIAGSEKPTLSSAQKNQDTALSTWTTSLTAGDILEFNVESAATVTRIMLSLKIQRT